MTFGSDLVLEDLRRAIRRMTYDTKLYLVLKEELTAMGYWKNRFRGKPDIRNLRKEVERDRERERRDAGSGNE